MNQPKESGVLKDKLREIDGKGYKAYKSIAGAYRHEDFLFYIDHVQGDPFASPSRVRVFLPQRKAGFPASLFKNESRRTGIDNYLAKRFGNLARKLSSSKGSGGSGRIEMDVPAQEMVPITAVNFNEQGVEARFYIGLPAKGRRILAKEAERLIFESVPYLVRKTLFYSSHSPEQVEQWANISEDADYLRESLDRERLVAFVANGSILPRRSGIDERPLEEDAVKFESPVSLEKSFNLPNCGKIKGMGIPTGVNLIVGGGYHGKSTLLKSLQNGVYNHCPGDGREFVVSVSDAVKIRAEEGRFVKKVNINPFINNLPYGGDTKDFTSTNASGSTSQAVNIMEALETGTSLLMIDEDTSATNFMIRDSRMQKLIAKKEEPITPFIDKVRQLSEQKEVSVILVMGGSGDYLDIADLVIGMENYYPKDLTSKAKEIAESFSTGRSKEGGEEFGKISSRCPESLNVDSSKTKVRGKDTIQLGRQVIKLNAVEQIIDDSQTNSLKEALFYASKYYINGKRTIREIMKIVMEDINHKGLDVLNPWRLGNLAYFRPQELSAALNRLRSLKVE